MFNTGIQVFLVMVGLAFLWWVIPFFLIDPELMKKLKIVLKFSSGRKMKLKNQVLHLKIIFIKNKYKRLYNFDLSYPDAFDIILDKKPTKKSRLFEKK